MSLKNKLNEIAHYICTEFPDVDTNNVSRDSTCVRNICNIFLKHSKGSDCNKTVVNALKNRNSPLHKKIELIKSGSEIKSLSIGSDPSALLDASKVMTCLKEFNYTIKDFEFKSRTTLKNVCKIVPDNKNLFKVLDKFRKVLKIDCSHDECDDLLSTDCSNLISSSNKSITSFVTSVDDQGVSSLKNFSDVFPTYNPSTEINENLEYKSLALINNSDDMSISETLCSLISPITSDAVVVNGNKILSPALSDFTLNNKIMKQQSTPMKEVSSLNECITPIKYGPIKKYKQTATPIKNAYYKKTPVKPGVILPNESVNDFLDLEKFRENNHKSFKNCFFEEGTISFTKDEWSNMIITTIFGKVELRKETYSLMFRKRVKTVNNTCVINMHSAHYPNTGKIRVYMYCSHEGCKSFNVEVSPNLNGAQAKVFSSSRNYYHDPENEGKTTYVKGDERDLVRNEVKKTSSFKYRANTIDESSPSKIDRGNLQKIKSNDVIRKIRSEALCADDYAKNDLDDLMCRYKDPNNKAYLKHVGLPVYAHCYSNEQLQIIKKIRKIDPTYTLTAHMDATGSVIRKVDKANKRPLYYAVVIRVPLPLKTKVTCPVLEMLSSAHDITAISQWLMAFKSFVIKSNLSWPIFPNVVTDFSYAQMHSLSMAWNGFNSVFDYLNWTYKVLYENHMDNWNVTVINICVNPYTKIIVNHVYKYYKGSKLDKTTSPKNCIISWICILFDVKSIEDIETWFRLFVLILISPSLNDEVLSAINMMECSCKVVDDELYKEDADYLETLDKEMCTSNTSRSLFYSRFQIIKNEIHDKLVTYKVQDKKNVYYDENYLNEFISKCIPYIPLWTPIMNVKVNNGITERQSNATVESHFKTLKQSLLECQTKLKSGRFLESCRGNVLNVYKQCMHNIRQKRATKSLKSTAKRQLEFKCKTYEDIVQNNSYKRHTDEAHLDAEEKWGRTPKRQKYLKPIGYHPFQAISKSAEKKRLNNTDSPKTGKQNVDEILINEINIETEMNQFDSKIEIIELTVSSQNCLRDNGDIIDKCVNYIENNKKNEMLNSFDSFQNDTSKISYKECNVEIEKFSSTSIPTPGSYKTPDKSITRNDLYSNKLPKNLDYYKEIEHKNRVSHLVKGRVKRLNFTVGTYHHIIYDTLSTLQSLNIEDFICLNGKNWLNNFVIDVCLAIKSPKKELGFSVLYCNQVSDILSKSEVNEEIANKYNFIENSTVIMPWCECAPSHWILAILKFKTIYNAENIPENSGKCYILDPFYPNLDPNDSSEARKYTSRFQKLNKALQKHCTYNGGQVPVITWIQYEDTNIPRQTDVFNCGVFVTYYAITIMNELKFDSEFDPNKYRIELKKLLLENSGDMTNICLYCSKHEDKHKGKYVEWVSCNKCCRWIAINCIAENYRLDDYINNDFYCILCNEAEDKTRTSLRLIERCQKNK